MSTAWIVLMSIWLGLIIAASAVSVRAVMLTRAKRHGEAASTWFLASALFAVALPFSLAAVAVA